MNTILLINGSKTFATSGGKLSATLQNVAKEELQKLGKTVIETKIEDGYDIATEVGKIMASDAIIWQMPAWWMGVPWTVKKYIDEVFMSSNGQFLTGDGRHHETPNTGYGTGGLLTDKKYLFSVTWNAPLAAFTEKDEFFEGLGVDRVYFALHKAMQFIGMKPLPTFMCNDVIKNPQIEQYIANYREHINKVFG
ncbi:MAG: NAD(P)H-dependent oxidoreductase [Neisseriaceae bacterium]|nr:NAD(P)H-dependent oxidoreductase [Neisseriaceae bacterium]MBR5676134.1 NAD(P)H-dependent oxidoreductase [Neisseriaceae bacterium]